MSDKQTAVYSYNGILLGHEKEQTIGPCNDLDEPWEHYVSVLQGLSRKLKSSRTEGTRAPE